MHSVSSILIYAWCLKALRRVLGPALSASKCVLSTFYRCTFGKDRVEFFVAPVMELPATETCLTAVNLAKQSMLAGPSWPNVGRFAAFGGNQGQAVLQCILSVSVS